MLKFGQNVAQISQNLPAVSKVGWFGNRRPDPGMPSLLLIFSTSYKIIEVMESLIYYKFLSKFKASDIALSFLLKRLLSANEGVEVQKSMESSGADFTKGLSQVSGSNLRFLSQIIGTFFWSPWAWPLWISQKVSVSALVVPLAQMLRVIGSKDKFVDKGSNMAAIILSTFQNLKWL